MLNFKSTPAPIQLEMVSWDDMLKSRPVPNRKMTTETTDEGVVIASVPVQQASWFVPPLTWVIKPRTHRRVALDPVGSEIFTLCNSKRRFEHVVDKFAESHHLTFHEARVAAGEYLKQLIHRGVIVIVGSA